MPQIVLEYSSNLAAPADFGPLFDKLHRALHRVAGIRLQNCKSRARIADNYYIGEGESDNAFLHLQIRFIEGRDASIKQAVGEQCLGILKQQFRDSIATMALQITVEVDDLLRDFYFKHPEGSLTPQ